MLASLGAQQLEVAGARQDAAGVEHGRLGDDRGDLVAALVHDALEAVGVVPRQDDERVGELLGHAEARGHRPRMVGRPGLVGVDVVAPVHDVLPTVVVTLEAHQQAPPGDRPRQAHGGAHGLAARVGEAHHLDARHRIDDLLGRLDLELVGRPEAGAQGGHRVLHRRGDHRVAMAEDHGPEAEQVVDVLVTVDVGHARARALGDERRVGDPAELEGTGTAARAGGDDATGALEELVRTRHLLVESGCEVHGHLLLTSRRGTDLVYSVCSVRHPSYPSRPATGNRDRRDGVSSVRHRTARTGASRHERVTRRRKRRRKREAHDLHARRDLRAA